MEDAKGFEGQFPEYRYGGMWKDRSPDGPLSARKPRKLEVRRQREADARGQASSSGAEAGQGEDGHEIVDEGERKRGEGKRGERKEGRDE